MKKPRRVYTEWVPRIYRVSFACGHHRWTTEQPPPAGQQWCHACGQYVLVHVALDRSSR